MRPAHQVCLGSMQKLLAPAVVCLTVFSLSGCVSVSSSSPVCQTSGTYSQTCGAGACGFEGQNDVPRELRKVSLPEYVIEPPDVLLIQTVNNIRPATAPVEVGEAYSCR